MPGLNEMLPSCRRRKSRPNAIPLGLWGDQKGMGAVDSPDVYYPFNGALYVQCRIIGYRNFDLWGREWLSPTAVFCHVEHE